METDTHFLNVDLDIKSKSDLKLLVDIFGDNVSIMHHQGIEGDGDFASFEISALKIGIDQDVGATIKAFCDLIEKLPKEFRKVWDECYERTLDIGLECGNTKNRFNTKIDKEIVHRIARLGMNIALTIYPTPEYTIEEEKLLQNK